MLSAILTLVGPLVTAADWPQWGGPNRDFVAPGEVRLADSWPPGGPPVNWERKLAAGGWAN